MARRLTLVLALAVVVLLAGASAATAQSDGKGKGPKEDKPEGPKPKPKPKEDKPEVPKPKPKEDKPEVPKPKPDKPEDLRPKPKEDKPEGPKSPPKGEGPKPKPKPSKVKCHDNRKVYPYCSPKQMDCPPECPDTCFADCNLCRAVCVCSKPGACGDPKFIGGDGNAFYFHGRKDADFCVVADHDLHINAHFIGKRGHSGMSRDFTWIQAIAVLFDGHSLYVGARKTGTWDDAVEHLEITLDGEPVHLPADDARWTSNRVPGLSVTRTKAANGVLVALTGKFSIRANAVPITQEDSRVHRYGVTSDDCLAHLELAFKFDALTDDVHGVVGQTYRTDYVNKFDVSASMPTMGGDASFTSSSLFAADCAVARFGTSHGGEGASVMSELARVTCASGMDGQGVVCKK